MDCNIILGLMVVLFLLPFFAQAENQLSSDEVVIKYPKTLSTGDVHGAVNEDNDVAMNNQDSPWLLESVDLPMKRKRQEVDLRTAVPVRVPVRAKQERPARC